MADELTAYRKDDLEGSYDCVDRLVINAYNPLCHEPAGFRFWWRRLMGGSDAELARQKGFLTQIEPSQARFS